MIQRNEIPVSLSKVNLLHDCHIFILSFMLSRPLIIAHRGASAAASENTLSAILLAFMQGADGVEVDLRLTSDGHLVAIHDEDTKRVSGVMMRVSRTPLEKLRTLDVGRVMSRKGQGQRMPVLDEVLGMMPPEKLLYLDLKVGVEGVKPLVAALKSAGELKRRVRVMSSQVETLTAVRSALPECEVVLHCDRRWTAKHERWVPEMEMIATVARAVGAFEVAVDSRSLISEEGLLPELSKNGIKTQVWTVNRAPSARRLAQLGVSAIKTDYPGHLISTFQNMEAADPMVAA
jgi:glycerophosphoryl diester phosphodiesterase